MKRSTILAIAVLCFILAMSYVTFTAEASKPTCDSCTRAGYPYLCRATINSGKCFQNAGDVTCDGDGCVCCKKQAGPGCESCDGDDVEDDDEDDV